MCNLSPSRLSTQSRNGLEFSNFSALFDQLLNVGDDAVGQKLLVVSLPHGALSWFDQEFLEIPAHIARIFRPIEKQVLAFNEAIASGGTGTFQEGVDWMLVGAIDIDSLGERESWHKAVAWSNPLDGVEDLLGLVGRLLLSIAMGKCKHLFVLAKATQLTFQN